MPDPRSTRRQLDRWAVIQGFASFDVYLQAGGSFLGAAAEMRREQQQLDLMLAYIANIAANFSRRPEPAPQPVATGDTIVGPEGPARLEAEHSDDQPGDATNAQIQGFDDP